MKRESISFGDRLVAAVMSAIIMGLMAIVAQAIIMFIIRPYRTVGRLFQVYGASYAWGPVVVLFAFATGFVLGTKRVTEVLGYLWYTAEPRRPGVTLTLWVVLVGIGVAAYWIFWYVL